MELTSGSARAELRPDRGALVTDWRVGGERVLFLDEATLIDVTKNVRGGIPLLFPFAGKPPPGSPLPQHGFARKRAWEVGATTSDSVDCVLRSDAETLAAWPYEFELRYRVQLTANQLLLEWRVHNRGAAPLPLHFGIHPYFQVGTKAGVQVEGAQGRAFDNTTGLERDVAQVDFAGGEVDLHFAAPASGHTVLERGDGRSVRLQWTPQFTRMVLWTLPGQPFVCVEPWTAPGAAPALHHVAAGQTERLAIELTFES